MRPKDADRMANSVDPDQTAPLDPDQPVLKLIMVNVWTQRTFCKLPNPLRQRLERAPKPKTNQC